MNDISFHPSGGAYELHGYVHIDVIVEFMVYVKGIIETCGHLASIRVKAAKDKMPKLKRIIDLWNARCKEISMRAEDQLRSMGDESEWQKFYEADENPFEGRSVSRPLFLDQEPIVEQVEGNPKLQTLSTTERSTTERITSSHPQPAKTKGKKNAGYHLSLIHI